MGAAFVAASGRLRRRHHLRHGRHEHRRRDGPRRPAAVDDAEHDRRPADRPADVRHPHRRRRRRIDRLRSTPAAHCASARDRPGAFPGPRATGAAGRCRPSPTPISLLGRIVPDMFLGGAMQRRRRPRPTRDRAARARDGQDRDRSGAGHRPRRRGEHGQRHPRRHQRSAGTIRAASRWSASAAPAGCTPAAWPRGWTSRASSIPPYCGVLSALGMVVAPPVVGCGSRRSFTSATQLDDADSPPSSRRLGWRRPQQLPHEQTQPIEDFADVRFRGQSHELKVPVDRHEPCRHRASVSRRVPHAIYGRPPSGRAIEIVTLRVRRIGHVPTVTLPRDRAAMPPHAVVRVDGIDRRATASRVHAAVLSRGADAWAGTSPRAGVVDRSRSDDVHSRRLDGVARSAERFSHRASD